MQNTVLCYLEESAKRFPKKQAVIDKNDSITFGELRNNALTIGKVIRDRLGDTKQPILVYLPKSVRSIEIFMGILYSGNFYTPTDVSFPCERMKKIIEDLNPAMIISDTENIQKLIDYGVSDEVVFNVDEIEYTEVEDTLYLNQIIDTDVVYVLFTSGSTGKPKGVVISNRSIIDYIDWAKQCYMISDSNIIGNQAPFYFDNSTLDIYLMLSTGATLYIVPEMLYSFPVKLMEYICEKHIDTIFWVPSVFMNVANADILNKIDCSCLRNILFAGEVMPNKHLNYWRKHIPNALYSNLYGPTEITVDCTYYIVDRDFKDDDSLPIGVPCINSNVMLLDENNNLILTSNEIGELCVRGSSLALGYWNDLNKTNEVFVQNPLNDKYPERIYRTGDLAHYNEYGEIMFDGRKDFQIKHMGYRIEIGEIENAILSISGIQEACVLYDAFLREIVLVFNGLDGVDKKYIRKKLLDKIPKYMIPTRFEQMDALPKTNNGKIDRQLIMSRYLA